MTAVVNEFAKMRHLHLGVMCAVLALAVIGLTILTSVVAPDFADPQTRRWEQLLAGLSMGVPLATPLLLAVCASRLVDAEHQGNGWLLGQTSGLTPGALCRAKFVVLGVLVAAASTIAVFVPMLFGLAIGIPNQLPMGTWIGFWACSLVVSLTVLALHVVIAAKVENQLVGLGIGLIGTILAVFASGLPTVARHLTPWGYYSLSTAAEYAGGELTLQTPSYLSVAALGLAAGALFLGVTAHFDRQEA